MTATELRDFIDRQLSRGTIPPDAEVVTITHADPDPKAVKQVLTSADPSNATGAFLVLVTD